MLIVYGCPSDKADYVVQKQYKYKWSRDTTTGYYGSNNLPTTTGQHIMDIGSGTDHAQSSS